MYKGFDSEGFFNWMGETFSLDRFRDTYSFQLIENVIEYAHKHEHISLDQFAGFVANMLPEVEFLEVAQFCSDEILTEQTRKELGRTENKNKEE